MTEKAELFLAAGAALAEGPMWDDREGVLYWVDILRGQVHRADPASGADAAFSVGQPVGTIVLREAGGLMLAVREGFAAFDPETEVLTPIADPEAHLPGNRFNDGKCDPGGRFWAGTMAFSAEPGAGALYRLDPDFRVHKMLENVTISNGLAWSSDHLTMYYIDSQPGTVSAFDYDLSTGAIQNRRIVIRVEEGLGLPDGMAIDADDKLWIAHYGGGCVRRWDPDTAEILETIPVPAANATACAFGGSDLGDLYITTAGGDNPDQLRADPQAGNLFVARPGVSGPAAYRFAG
jgi:sugar lactone lactonase YvrE